MENKAVDLGHKTDPRLKLKKEWILGNVKALVQSGCVATQDRAFMPMAAHYNKMKLYSIGKQPTGHLRKAFQIDGAADVTTANLDYTPTKVHLKIRDIAVAKVLQNVYDPIATPIDMQAKNKSDEAYTNMKAKLMMKKMLEQQDPQLAASPVFKQNDKEPQDLDELEMRAQFGEQFVRSMDSELMVGLAFHMNKVPQSVRKPIVEDWFDCGIGGYKDSLDANGKPNVRHCDLRNVVTSYCTKEDFSDATFFGEVVTPNIEEIMPLVNEAEKIQLKELASGGIVNTTTDMPGITFMPLPKGKVRVLDVEFLSVNTITYQVAADKFGNPKSSKRPHGEKGEGIITNDKQVVYKAKWVLGTDILYDFGLAENQKRKHNKKDSCNTTMSYKFWAYSFHDMYVSSYMERMIPSIEEYQTLKLKLQNIRNNQIVNGFAIDLDALESVNIAQGGAAMGKKQILELFRQRGILLYRGKGLNATNPNAKPIDQIVNQIAGEVESIMYQMSICIQDMNQIIGLNEVTDASTPSDRMSNAGFNNANLSTNNALWPLLNVDVVMLTQLAVDMDMRVKQSIIINGSYEGYMPGINETTLRFVKSGSDYHLHDHAIMIDMRPTKEQKQFIIEQMQPNMVAGLISLAEVFTVLATNNMKQAEMILSYRVEKNRKRQEDMQQQNQMMNIEGQKQSGMAVEKSKQETMQLEYQLKAMLEKDKHEYKMEEIELMQSMQGQIAQGGNVTKLATTAIAAQSKVPEGMMQMPEEVEEPEMMEPEMMEEQPMM